MSGRGVVFVLAHAGQVSTHPGTFNLHDITAWFRLGDVQQGAESATSGHENFTVVVLASRACGHGETIDRVRRLVQHSG